MANEVNPITLTAQEPRGPLFLGGPNYGAKVVPINAGDGVYGGQTGSVLFKNCNAIPVDNSDLTNKRYVDDTITSVINSIEGLGNISHTTLSNITALVGDQTARGSILNNALVIQALENSLGMEIADNLGTGASGNTGTNVNTQFIPSLTKNPLKSNNDTGVSTHFSLDQFLAEIRRGTLDQKVLSNNAVKLNPTLADHLSNIYGAVDSDGSLSIPQRNGNTTINSQLGNLFYQLTGYEEDFNDETSPEIALITTRNDLDNVNAQIGELYAQISGEAFSITARQSYNDITLSNIDAQLGDLYSRDSTNSENITAVSALVGSSITSQGTDLITVSQQLSRLYSQDLTKSENITSIQGVIGGTNGSITPHGTNLTVSQQLVFLYDRLALLYQYFLNHDLNTDPGNVTSTGGGGTEGSGGGTEGGGGGDTGGGGSDTGGGGGDTGTGGGDTGGGGGGGDAGGGGGGGDAGGGDAGGGDAGGGDTGGGGGGGDAGGGDAGGGDTNFPDPFQMATQMIYSELLLALQAKANAYNSSIAAAEFAVNALNGNLTSNVEDADEAATQAEGYATDASDAFIRAKLVADGISASYSQFSDIGAIEACVNAATDSASEARISSNSVKDLIIAS